jgi:hypothetical protein
MVKIAQLWEKGPVIVVAFILDNIEGAGQKYLPQGQSDQKNPERTRFV